MTTEQVATVLEKRVGEAVTISRVEVMPWREEKMQRSWRDYLLMVFRRRLHHAQERGVAKEVIVEVQSFLARLEVFDRSQTLSSFSARSKMKAYDGWMIDEEIVYCIPSEK